VACDNSNTHEDDEFKTDVRVAACRLALLYLLTYNHWLNPLGML
jgi:hypothetical protein